MKCSRLLFAAVLSSSLVLVSACSEDTPTPTTPGTVAPTATVDGPTATGDTAIPSGDTVGQTGTAAPDTQTTTAPATITAAPAGEGVVSLDEAQELADTLLRQAVKSQKADPDKAGKLIAQTFSGAEKEANSAAVKLRGVRKETAEYAPGKANVLAISREDGKKPGMILVQTVPKSGVPELHVLTDEGKGGKWRIAWTAMMLPGTQIGTFDRRSEGSPLIRRGKGSLEQRPVTWFKQFAKYVAYPDPVKQPRFKTNGYSPQVRKEAREQGSGVAAQASFKQTNKVQADSVRTFTLADGSALSFAVLDRSSTFTVRSGSFLKPPAAFRVFNDDGYLTDDATLSSLVFVALHLPLDGSRPEVIAAREQIVGANGS